MGANTQARVWINHHPTNHRLNPATSPFREQLVPSGIQLDTNQLDRTATQPPLTPKKFSGIIDIHPVKEAFFVRVRRRTMSNNIVFVTAFFMVNPGNITYWHTDPTAESESLGNAEVYDRIAQIWERQFVQPYDPFGL